MSRRSAAVLLAASLVAACGEPAPPPDSVARIAGQELTWETFRVYLAENGVDSPSEVADEILSGLLDRFLAEEALRRMARQEGWIGDDAGRRDALEAALRHRPPEMPGEAEVREYYESHLGRFDLPERVHLQQILVGDRATAEALVAELEDGAEFESLARSHSTDPSGAAGGDQGFLSRRDLPPHLAERVFALGEGEASRVVETRYGFLLFRVVRRLPPERLTLEEASADIRLLLARQQADRQLADLLRSAQTRYDPEVFEGNLPFVYSRSPRPVKRHPSAP